MIDDIKRIAAEKLGEGASPSEVIDFLFQRKAISVKRARWFIVGHEFFRMLTETERTARDIENELADRYGITSKQVQNIRMAFKR